MPLKGQENRCTENTIKNMPSGMPHNVSHARFSQKMERRTSSEQSKNAYAEREQSKCHVLSIRKAKQK